MRPRLVALALLVLLAACGGRERPPPAPERDELVGTADVERLLVSTQKRKSPNLRVGAASCPDQVRLANGTMFTCTVQIEGVLAPYSVTLRDVDATGTGGRFALEPARPIIDVTRIVSLIRSKLQPTARAATVRCGAPGAPKVRVVEIGASIGCTITFQGSGSTWTRAQSPLRGRVLAAADDGSSTFLLCQSSSGVWVAKRPHTGGLVNVQRISTRGLGGAAFSAGDLVAFTDQWWAVWNEQVGPGGEFAPLKLFQSKTIGAGDCIDPIVKQQITVNQSLDDERPSIVLEPASAGASGAELFFARTNGAVGTSGHIWRGAAGCDADWSFRQLSFAGQVDVNPDASRSGVGNNHVTFQRDGSHIVYLNNSSGTYRGRQFATPGVEPRVTTSQGVVFVAFRDFRQHPFVAIFRSGAWSGRDLTPGAGGQLVLAVTASGGRGTVLAASFSSHRLYAVADL